MGSTKSNQTSFKRAQILIVLCVFLFGGASSCSSSIIPTFPANDGYTETTVERRREVEVALLAQASSVASVRTILRGVATHESGSGEFRQVLSFHAPDRLRIEFVIGALKQTAAIVINPGPLLYFIDRQEKRAYRGASTLENVEKLLRVPFTSSEVGLFFTGRFFSTDKTVFKNWILLENPLNRAAIAEFELADGRSVRIHLSEPEQIQAVEVSVAGKRLLYAEFERKQGAELPIKLKVWLPERGMSARYSFEDGGINPEWGERVEKLYRVRIPKGFTVYNLDYLVDRESAELFAAP